MTMRHLFYAQVGPLSTKTRHSHVAKGGTYETLEIQDKRNKLYLLKEGADN